jgi:hypothetical protein
MNQKIADIIKTKIECLDFVDKIAGLVSTTYMNVTDENGNKVQKAFPIACNVTAEDCKQGLYNDLCPDSKYKTVIYFEDGGVRLNERKGNNICYTSNLKLVCWINVALYKADCCGDNGGCSSSADIIKKILCVLPGQPENIDPYIKVMPIVISQDVRSNSIFGKYTYNEKQVQYLMYPFDFFALNIQTTFCVCLDCDIMTCD